VEESAARESGKRVGNHRRMRGGNKTLKRVFYQLVFSSLRGAPESRVFYDRKRGDEGKRHTQALIALARRRVNVLCGRCCVMEPRLRAALPLDIFIEILPGTGVKIALVEELFSWFWGGPARVMSHLGE
jgi:hypothetical protein